MKGLPEFSDIRIHWKGVKNIDIGFNSMGLRTVFINGWRVRCSPKRNKLFDGGSRICYLGIDFIIKVDCPLNYYYNHLEPSWCQGDHEYRIWMSLDDYDRQYFAEVLDYQKNNYIVFKRYNIPQDNCSMSKHNKKLLEDLTSKYELSDINWGDSYTQNHNATEIDGKLLIFDYGLSSDEDECANKGTPAYMKFIQKKRR